MIPNWWLVLSAIFFCLQSLLVLSLIGAVLYAIKLLKELQPKVAAVSDKVHDIGEKVEDLTTNVKETMATLGGRAKSVAGSADIIAHTASRTFEKYSPLVAGILSALRILRAVQQFRAKKSEGASEPGKVDKKSKKREQ